MKKVNQPSNSIHKAREKEPSSSEKNNENINSRREFIKNALIAAVVFPVAYYILKKVTSYKEPEKPDAQTFLNAAKAIEAKGLGTVEWIHPEGHVGELPENPSFLITDFHEGLKKAERSEAHLKVQYTEFLILLELADSGCMYFRFEGVASDHLVDSKAKGETRGERRNKYMNYEEFAAGGRKSTAAGLNSFALEAIRSSVKETVIMRGAEDPSLVPELIETINRRDEIQRKNIPFLTFVLRNGKIKITPDRTKVMTTEGLVDALEQCQNLKKELEVDEEIKKLCLRRDAYTAENIQGDVIVFGAAHAKNLSTIIPAKGRSIGIIRPKGADGLDATMDGLIKIRNSSLETLEKNTKNLKVLP